MIAFRYKAFLEVAQQLSFSKAAEILSVSQPAISKHVKALEEEHKIKLFERQGSRIKLTRAGKLLFDYLCQTAQIELKLSYDLSTMMQEEQAKGQLVLGASTTMALYLLPKVLSDYHRKFPQVDISMINRNAENILQALLDHKIDLGIAEVFSRTNEIRYDRFVTDEIALVSSSEAYSTTSDGISVDQLFSIELASREVGSGTLHMVKNALVQQGYNPKKLQIRVTLGGTEALKNFLISSTEAGFLPLKAIQRELERKELFIIPIKGLTINRQFYFMQRQGETNPLALQFIKHAKNHYNLKL